MTRERKDTAMVISALAMLAFAACLTTAGFIIEPRGEVHDSVLWVLGQTFFYAGGIFGVTAYTTGRMRHLQETVSKEIEMRFRALEHGEQVEPTNEEDDETDEEL